MSDRAKFDLDLQYGQDGERWLTWLGTDQAKVEVKTERDTWATTGNAVFEYKCRGKASGIAVTTSDYWMHVFKLHDVALMVMTFHTQDLREFLRECHSTAGIHGSRLTIGGDDNASEVILVPIQSLWKVSCRLLPFVTQRNGKPTT